MFPVSVLWISVTAADDQSSIVCEMFSFASFVWSARLCSLTVFPKCIRSVPIPYCIYIVCVSLCSFLPLCGSSVCLFVCFCPAQFLYFSFFSNIKTVIFTSLISSHLAFLSCLQFVQNVAPHRHPKKRSYYSCFNFSPVVASQFYNHFQVSPVCLQNPSWFGCFLHLWPLAALFSFQVPLIS